MILRYERIDSPLLRPQIHSGGADTDKKSLEESSQTALEAVTNMRTVASIQKETYFFQRYKQQLEIIRFASCINGRINNSLDYPSQSINQFTCKLEIESFSYLVLVF